MPPPPELPEKDPSELVAYLDGELTEAEAHELEARIVRDPQLRNDVHSLKKAWDLLDYLPKVEPPVNFTQQTLSRLESRPKKKTLAPGWLRQLAPLLYSLAWVLGIILFGSLGYFGYLRMSSRPSQDQELVRDLRLLENLPWYDGIENLQFLRDLDHPDLFGEDSSGK